MRSSEDRRPPPVVVAVGTDHHRFDRLMSWIDAWAASRPGIEVLVQRGTSSPPGCVDSVELIGHAELLRSFAAAVVVVCHAGPSTVMDARAAGRLPIVVARQPALGEHVDDHQVRFARHLDQHDLACVVEDRAGFEAMLDRALADPAAFTVEPAPAEAQGIAEFGRAVDRLLADGARPHRR